MLRLLEVNLKELEKKSNMKKVYVAIVSFLASLVLGYYYFIIGTENKYKEMLFAVFWIFFSGSITAFFTYLSDNYKAVLLAIRCLFYPNQRIYVSLSYLFQIKLKGKNVYLMVKGNRIDWQYQPVGGVYKIYPSIGDKWIKWGAEAYKNKPEDSDDLRFTAKRSAIPEIRKWFFEGKNREIDIWREFSEELFSTEILDKDQFGYIKAEYSCHYEEHLIKRIGIDERQFLIYNVYGLNLTDNQEVILSDLYNTKKLSYKYAFVDEKFLDKELFKADGIEYKIGGHAKYLMQN